MGFYICNGSAHLSPQIWLPKDKFEFEMKQFYRSTSLGGRH